MISDDDKFAAYVDHPRYGRGPRYTGLNPDCLAPDVSLHWNSTSHREIAQRFQALTGQTWRVADQWFHTTEVKRIPGTAVVADLTRQSRATVQVTHYFDLDRICRDCSRPFIFFADEQKYWYEELGFGLDSDCVRCVACRKPRQVIAQRLKQYNKLLNLPVRGIDENVELADCCLSLIESSVFTPKQLQRVRALIKRVSHETDSTTPGSYNDLLARVRVIEAAAQSNTRNGSQ
ncbi:MAG: hypothetical protein JWN70_890 [Planctomycetaceae bacterium]|nr:hypothetical protein [Planctomycetaceae bacterium]